MIVHVRFIAFPLSAQLALASGASRFSDETEVERDQKENEMDQSAHAAEFWRLNEAGA
jgi:hypothetical protein